MLKKIISLYVDDSSLRLLVTRGKKIKKWAELPLEPGLFRGNSVINEQGFAMRVRLLLKAEKVKARRVIVGISGLHCLTRPAVLPQLPKAMLAEAVMREAKRVLPVALDQLYISWRAAPAPDEKISVFMVAIPRNIADSLLKALRLAGLKPDLMDIKPLILARLAGEKTSIIVDMQPGEFDIVIKSDGVPQPIRTLSFPGERPSREEKLLMVKAELDRTIKFYDSNNPKGTLAPDTPIFVSGELADEPALQKELSEEFGRPVFHLSSPLKCPWQLDSNRHLVSIGLALIKLGQEGDAAPSMAVMNVLPAPYRAKPIPLARLVAVPGIAILIGLLVIVAIFVRGVSADVASLNSQLDNANHLIKQRQAQKDGLVKGLAELEKKIAQAESQRDTFARVIEHIENQSNVLDGDLLTTVSCLPPDISLSNISRVSGRVNLNGMSASEIEILTYARALDASDRFSEVIIASVMEVEATDNETYSGMKFTLVLKAKE